MEIEERNLIVEEMKGNLEKISEDIYQNLQKVSRITSRPNKLLMKRYDEIQALQKSFGSYLSYKPYLFQKFTLPSLLLAKELLSKARDEINSITIEDLAIEIADRQQKIDQLLDRG